MTPFRRALAALDRHWFAPASLRDLAIVRILTFGSQTLVFLWLPIGRARSLGEQLHQASAGGERYAPVVALRALLLPFGQLGAEPPSAEFLTATYGAAIVAGLLATVGLWARPAMLVAAAANLLLVAHHYSYGEYHHAEALMLIALGVLALGPSAAVWSVDAWRRQRRTGVARSDVSPFARWPLRLIQWVIALSYLSAAGAKLATGGLAWFNGYSMAFHYLVLGASGQHEVAALLATLPPRWHILPSVFGWAVEAFFFVAILWPRTAWLFVLGGVALHLGIYVAMGIAFFQTMLLYCVFIESLRRFGPRDLCRRRVGRTPGVRRAAAIATG